MGLDVEHEVGRGALDPQLGQASRRQGVVGRVDLHHREPRRVVLRAAPRPCRRRWVEHAGGGHRRVGPGRGPDPDRGGRRALRAARWRPRRSPPLEPAARDVRAGVVGGVEVVRRPVLGRSPAVRARGAMHGSLAGGRPARRAPGGRPLRTRRPSAAGENRSRARSRIARRSSSATFSTAQDASSTSSTRNPVTPCSIVSVRRAGPAGDHRRAGRHRLDRDEPERLRPVAEHHRRERAGVQRVALARPDLAQEVDLVRVDRGLDDLVEVRVLAGRDAPSRRP